MTTIQGSGVPAPDGLPLDQIRISGVTARGFHGVLPEERAQGQEFSADVVLHLDTRAAAAVDRIEDTVSYADVARDVHAVLAGDPADLVETVAERIAAVVLARPQVAAVDVSVHKPQAPIPVPFGDVEVSIRRDRVRTPVVTTPVFEAPPAEHASFEQHAGDPTPPPSFAPAAEALAPEPSAYEQQPARDERAPFEASAYETPALEAAAYEAPAYEQPGYEQPAAFEAAPPAYEPAPAAYEQQGYEQPGYQQPGYEQPGYEQPPAFEAAPPAFEPAGAQPEQSYAEPSYEHHVAEPQAPAEPQQAWDQPQQPAWEEAAGVPEASAAVGQEAPQGERAPDRMDEVPTGSVDVVLALGANLGDPQATLRSAVTALDRVAGLQITDVSPLARTAAVGGPDQPDYLNAVLLARTTLSARELLHATQDVEAEHGRVREEHWGPRTLDVDVIVYGTLTAVSDDLELPHPRAHERAFVLEPWAQVAPDAVLPGLGGGPVAALAATAPDRAGIRWLALDWLTDDAPAGDGGRPPAPEAPAPLPSRPVAIPPSVAPAPQAASTDVLGEQPQAYANVPTPLPVHPPADQHPQAYGSGSLAHPQTYTSGSLAHPQSFGSGSLGHLQSHVSGSVPAPVEAFLPSPSAAAPLPPVVPAPQTPVAPPVPLAVRETARQEPTPEPLTHPGAPPVAPAFAPVSVPQQPSGGVVPLGPAPGALPPVGHAPSDDAPRPVFAPIAPPSAPAGPPAGGVLPPVPNVPAPGFGDPAAPGALGGPGSIAVPGTLAAPGGLVTGVPGIGSPQAAPAEPSDIVESLPSWAPVRDDGRGRDA